MHKFMGELGLSPVSRSRVTAFPKALGPKPWEYGLDNSEFGDLIAPTGPTDRFSNDSRGVVWPVELACAGLAQGSPAMGHLTAAP